MKMHFLLAEWNNVIMANYKVPEELLLPYVPYQTELDFFEGNTYVSLVGFMFLNTRLLGFSIPFHNNFEVVNLRFYVKHHEHGFWKRGVVFIKEIVPKQGISFIANNLYGENYETMKMKHYNLDKGDCLAAGYEWEYKNKWNKLSAETHKKSTPIKYSSHEEYIADHYWGYTRFNESTTYEFRVEHPIWETLQVYSYLVDCDFAALFGKEFSFLTAEKPETVFFLKGSEIRVFQKRTLK